MPHSPRLFGGMLYVLNGGQGEVLQVDGSSGRSKVVTALPAFTHGLAAHAGILFVGMSQDRVTRKKGPPPVTGRARAMVAGVAAIDMNSGRILGGLDFTAGVTEVYDVQTLPESAARACRIYLRLTATWPWIRRMPHSGRSGRRMECITCRMSPVPEITTLRSGPSPSTRSNHVFHEAGFIHISS